MIFFFSMFICNLLIPLVMLIGGYFMNKKPPKEINGWIGYRTKRSKKNKDTWAFAHEYCGRSWMKKGWIFLVLSILVQLPFMKSKDEEIGILTLVLETVQMIALLGSVIRTERALERTFDSDGNKDKK